MAEVLCVRAWVPSVQRSFHETLTDLLGESIDVLVLGDALRACSRLENARNASPRRTISKAETAEASKLDCSSHSLKGNIEKTG